MAILSTYKNELGIAELVSRQWPAEKRERLLKELAANPMGSISARPLKQEDQSALLANKLDKGDK
mgnify:CR=1 FL=1